MSMDRREFAVLLASAAPRSGNAYDVAVAGAGVFGAWTAYLLHRAGKSVILLDGYGPANSRASSGGESRIIRMGYGKDEIYTRWSWSSLSLWKELARETRLPLFQKTGVLWISRADDPRTRDSRAVLEKLGIPIEPLTNGELARRYPQIWIAPGLIGGLEPESGALMARRAVQAVVSEAVRAGCEWIPEAVAPPEGARRLETVRILTNQQIKASTFVFACGPWLPKVFPGLLGKRIFPTRQEVFFFGIPAGDRRFAPPQLPVWIDFSNDAGPYGFPDLESRGFKLAFDRHGPPFDPDTGSRFLTPEGITDARDYIAQRFPALRDAPIVESRVCQYENTSNGDFLIDRHPDFENVWLVGGGSGHGFKHGPAVGQYVTTHILNGGPVDSRFSLAMKAETQQRSVY
jgi:glycine/D-amino acid oxidase-like deaminating enzyme